MSTPSAGAHTGSHELPPGPVPNQAPQGESNFADGSIPMFSMYLERAAEEDKKMAEGWKADADGILFFTGLFSAAVATLISFSIQDIQRNPQDTSVFYLANIYQLMADPNRSNISLPLSPPTFSPPTSALWVNALWFLSLVISLTCALLATLLQQWARRYIRVTQPHYGPPKKARIRAFFAEGVERRHVQLVVEALPTLLHLSLFFFFAGLVVYLCNVNLLIFHVVLSWVIVGIAGYGWFTLMPIFRHNSPFYTPLSLPAWLIVNGVPFIIFRFLRWYTLSPDTGLHSRQSPTFNRFSGLEEWFYKLLSQGMLKTAEETARNLSSEIDTRAFMWTFDSLDEDDELERFFANLPGFRSSKVVGDPLPGLTPKQKLKLFEELFGLLGRSFSSDLLPESDKHRRAIVCARAIDPTDISEALECVLRKILSEDQHRGLQTIEFGHFVSGWGDSRDQRVVLLVQAIVSVILAKVQRRDDRWSALASRELGVPESDIRGHVTHSDSFSLTILIHITRQVHSAFSGLAPQARSQVTELLSEWFKKEKELLSDVLGKVSKSTAAVRETSAEIQHDFCALWNQIVLEARSSNGLLAWFILRRIRNVYIDLHRGTDASPTDFTASTSDQDKILRHQYAYPLCRVHDRDQNLTFHTHDISSSITLRSTDLTRIEGTSPDPAAETHPFIGTWTPTPPLTAAPILLGAVSRRNNVDPRTSYVSDAPSPPPHFPRTCSFSSSQLSQDPPAILSNYSPWPEPRPSIPAPIRPCTSIAPDPYDVAESASSAKPDTANSTASPDYPLQLPSPPSTTGTAIAYLSRSSLVDAEQQGNHHPHPSHDNYNASLKMA
ncbi:hypothetical protein EDB87DRAFT_1833244 [Lactarius vividus]|nr:hypothetical protein EDB87DRAFT_1833244 [Lactarius vividus]